MEREKSEWGDCLTGCEAFRDAYEFGEEWMNQFASFVFEVEMDTITYGTAICACARGQAWWKAFALVSWVISGRHSP